MLHNKHLRFSLFSVLLIGLFLVRPLHAAVVTSIKPIGFIAAAIADGVIPVKVLLPDGASEHDYALRPSDIKQLKNADLVVWVGPEMEAFMTKTAATILPEKQLQLAALPAIKPRLIAEKNSDESLSSDQDRKMADNHDADKHHHYHDQYNLHLWLSPVIAWDSAVAIHQKLLELMPRSRDKLDANLLQFKMELAALDRSIGAQLAPVKNKGYFVFHDAYRYFEEHYGLSPLGYFTVNPEIQPGAQRLHLIRTQLVERKAVCIFAEPQFRPAVIDAVARGTSVHKGVLDPLGINISLSKDSYVKFLSQLSSQYASCLKEA